jgi:signal transduction histidine kinase
MFPILSLTPAAIAIPAGLPAGLVMGLLLGVVIGAAVAFGLGARAGSSHARRQLESLSEGLEAGVVLFTAGGEAEFANRRAQKLLGCADLASFRAAARDPGLRDAVDLASRGGTTGRIELESGPRAVQFELRPAGGGRVWALVRDRRALDSLESDLRLAAHTRGVARILGAAAHEVRGPLNAMVLNLELLAALFDPSNADPAPANLADSQRYVGIISTELKRLHELLEVLLTHMPSGKDVPGHFDLREPIRELARLIEPYCRRHRVHVNLSLPERPVCLEGSRSAVGQTLSILAIDALEAMPGGGTLDLSLESNGHRAKLVVVDSRETARAELPEHFLALHALIHESNTEIGLYAARSAVASHGGELRVKPSPTRGSRFEIDLPIATQEG